MKTPQAQPRPLFVLSLLLFSSTFLHPILAVHYASAPTPSTQTAPTNGSEFIRTSCNATLYPDICYSSLAGYSTSVQQNPARLATAAITLTLSKVKRVAVYVSNLSRQADFGADPRAAAALHDCFSNFGDAVDEIYGSLKQMRQLGSAVHSGSKVSFRFQMSNVQTWMSAALTDEETCTDGFEDVPEGQLKTDVCNRATYVKKLTSNALALVNSYAEKEMNL
ncbi:hypothetical protein ACOSP7_019468 [Xanthoceras sorbifolium]|uniref:Pectinesterase inhibitor domain-containing protein n=1 Tax=Xanthoceras sorbifolium TaxID=99658 RepID=A0ABQ8I392_9ROSI|nr:hypothetical protein JRO89_XS05G0224200 [Xanthoceras sorbifolium]